MPSVLNADALTTLSSLKDEISVSSSDTSQDNRLERIINRVTGWIEGETHRKLKARNYNGKSTAFSTTSITSEDYIIFSGSRQERGGNTLVIPDTSFGYDPFGSSALRYGQCGYGQVFLPAYPIQTASPALDVKLDILADRAANDWDTTSYTLNTDFIVDTDSGILTLLSGPFVPGIKNYRVTCTAGELNGAAQPFVPSDLEGLCLELCKLMYRDSRTLQAEQIGSWSRTYNVQAKDPFLQAILAKYTRQLV